MFDKEQARKLFKERRRTLKDETKDRSIACSAVRGFGEFHSYFVYLSFGSEVGTLSLLQMLIDRQKKICVPRIEAGRMRAVPYSDKLERGPYGILQPEAGDEETCDIAFAPLLAFDGSGERLGYGGGYYDRYFASHPQVLRVGLAYAGQQGAWRAEDGDVPLDAVITEEGILVFSDRARIVLGKN